MPVQRTPEQEAVVKNRGGGLLVSAAAGSGKTRVLVERLLDRILTEGKNVDEFLIITFTRAAAEELRGRIGQELAQAGRAESSTRPRSPPSTPSAPSCFASGGICWMCPPTLPCVKRRRPRSSWTAP